MTTLYILQRNRPLKNGHPAYVSRSGSDKSYTSSVLRARVFQSLNAAESERCGNEIPVRVARDGQLGLDL
jgi:hypothetical protein